MLNTVFQGDNGLIARMMVKAQQDPRYFFYNSAYVSSPLDENAVRELVAFPRKKEDPNKVTVRMLGGNISKSKNTAADFSSTDPLLDPTTEAELQSFVLSSAGFNLPEPTMDILGQGVHLQFRSLTQEFSNIPDKEAYGDLFGYIKAHLCNLSPTDGLYRWFELVRKMKDPVFQELKKLGNKRMPDEELVFQMFDKIHRVQQRMDCFFIKYHEDNDYSAQLQKVLDPTAQVTKVLANPALRKTMQTILQFYNALNAVVRAQHAQATDVTSFAASAVFPKLASTYNAKRHSMVHVLAPSLEKIEGLRELMEDVSDVSKFTSYSSQYATSWKEWFGIVEKEVKETRPVDIDSPLISSNETIECFRMLEKFARELKPKVDAFTAADEEMKAKIQALFTALGEDPATPKLDPVMNTVSTFFGNVRDEIDRLEKDRLLNPSLASAAPAAPVAPVAPPAPPAPTPGGPAPSPSPATAAAGGGGGGQPLATNPGGPAPSKAATRAERTRALFLQAQSAALSAGDPSQLGNPPPVSAGNPQAAETEADEQAVRTASLLASRVHTVPYIPPSSSSSQTGQLQAGNPNNWETN